MNLDCKGGLSAYARALAQAQVPPKPERKAGDLRVVEVNGRKVRLLTIARPAAPQRPAAQAGLQRIAEAQPEPSTTPPALADRPVQVAPMGLHRVDEIVRAHLADQAKGTAFGSFTEAVHDVASFHDAGAGWMVAFAPGLPSTWPPTPQFMGRVFAQVLDPGFAQTSQAMAYAEATLAGPLLHELLQGLLVPGHLLSKTEQLRCVKADDPFHAEAAAIRKKMLADHGKYDLPVAVDSAVQALMLGTRGTAHQEDVDRAVVAMLATASQRLTGASLRRLTLAVHAGMKGEPAAGAAGK